MSSSDRCFLTCIQVSQEAGKVVWVFPSLLRMFHGLLWSTHSEAKFSLVIEAKVDVFLEFSCFFCDPVDVVNMISGSSAFSKSSLHTGKFSVHVLLKPSLENFEHYFASVWDECNCAVVRTFFALPFFGIGMKTDLFHSCGHCWVLQICWHWVQHFTSIIF